MKTMITTGHLDNSKVATIQHRSLDVYNLRQKKIHKVQAVRKHRRQGTYVVYDLRTLMAADGH
jgi:hypothetical protein